MVGTLTLVVAGLLSGVEPLQTQFVQVAPRPVQVGDLVRSTDARRAVVLIHGFRLEKTDFEATRAVMQDWQESDSLLVKMLARDSDVFAFAYGLNLAVEQVAASPLLK